MSVDRPISGYEYKMVYRLMHEPLAASEMAEEEPFKRWVAFNKNPTLGMVNRLRPLVERGWLTLEDGIYRASDKALKAVSW